ncbi:MAG: hypothetical protein ABSE63_13550 [Thermoguttaceae bacterium]|jgi:hypothetical protein
MKPLAVSRNIDLRVYDKITCATACLQAVLGEVPEKRCWQYSSGTHLALLLHFVRSF